MIHGQPSCELARLLRDHLALFVRRRVALGGKDDAGAVLVLELHLAREQHAAHAAAHDLIQVALEQRQNNLSLWVPEAAIELEHLWPGGSDDDPRVQDADEREAVLNSAVHGALHDLERHRCAQRRRQDRRRGVRSHSASVRALIPVKHALVVLRPRHEHHRPAVAKPEHGHLLALQALLHHDLRTSLPEHRVDHHALELGLGLLDRVREHHAFASR
mmetsp:Transcript_18798/g.47565  ORF Transcript_18798/g.47565 Transcript_18798/m.47565 type:complete len:217 (+) Transcript_18798:1040-1690(+)